MPQQIEVPGLGVVEFPDGMSDDDISAAIGRSMQAQYSTAPNSFAGGVNEFMDKIEAAPYVGPFVKGVRDVTKGGAQWLAHGINSVAPSILSDEDLRNVDSDARVGERKYQDARQARGEDGVDWGRMAGSALVTYPLAPLRAASIPATIGKGAAVGGAIGALSPVTGDSESFAAQKAKQVGIGAAGGGAASALGAGLSRVIRPNTAPEVQQLINQGVTPTPGQILGNGFARFEEKLTSAPVLGGMITNAKRRSMDDFNRAAYARALDPIGQKAPASVGRQGVEAVKDALGKAYDDILPKLLFKADQQFSDELANLTSMARSMPAPQAKQFEKIVREKLVSRLGPQGAMDGMALKGVESELNRIAKGYRGDASFDNRQLGDAVGELLTSVRSSLQRTNPQFADDLAKINQGYGNYALIRDAASKQGAADGIFTPAQLSAAVRAADKSAGKGKFATGKARLQDLSDPGKSVLGSKYPDSGTAGRGFAVGSALGSVPAAVLAYQNPMLGALTLGGTLLGGGAAMAPYTALGQRLAAGLLTKRPDAAAPIARGLLSTSPMLGAASAGGLLGLYGPSAP
jgi:hypothetical protein